MLLKTPNNKNKGFKEIEKNNLKSLFKSNLIKKENKVPVYLKQHCFLIISQFCIYSLVKRIDI